MIMTSSPKEEKNSNDCPEEKELHEQIDDNMTSSTNNNHCNEQQVHEEVDGDLHADEKDGDESTGKSNGQDAKSLLSSKIDDLQSTLNQVRRDTESEIARLRDELIEKNRTLEKLQIQLTEQRDYELLKRQCEQEKIEVRDIKRPQQFYFERDRIARLSPSSSAPPGNSSNPPNSPRNLNIQEIIPPQLRFGILKTMAPKSKSPELVTAATNEDFNEKSSTTPDDQTLPSPKGLEMFLLQRAKALQHANPALKALVDIQAAMGNNSWLGEAMKGHFEKSNEKKGTEESEQRLRKSLEHSLLPLPHLPTSLSSCPVIPPSQSPSNHSNNSDTDKDSRSTPSQLAVATTNGSCSKSVSDDDIIKHDTTMRKENPIISLSTSLMNQPTSGLISSTRIPKSDPMEGALQDMLRYNMEKFAGQSLDTIGAARRVRELLSVHNIGQRLFAKYVLGLSQGTVSELLSKPKCWEKLTEKGRDSYRKMHAWAYDENAILLLKSLIPRKDGPTAQDSEAKARFPNYPRFPFPMPLGGDAKKLMDPTVDFPLKPVPKQEDEVSDLTRSKNKIDIENKDPFQRFGLHGLNSFLGKTADDMQRAVEVYQMELARLQQQRSNAAVSSVFGIEDQPDRSPSKSDHDEDTLLAKEVRGLTQKFNPLAGLPCPPTGVPSSIAAPPLSLMMPQLEKKMVSSSPLQGMASITNSLTAQPLPSPYRPPQRSFKAILPPITQEEFDRFDSINTEEIVRKVKEILSQYSISQRLFGESILGLSQGSVSDLLARPKQFHMLTQKGKEPFIRMKLFLEDEQAVHKLVASQYKISPEKLMRTGNYTGSFLPSPTSGMSFNVGKVVQPLSPKLPTSEIAPPPFLLRSTSPSSLIPSSARFPSASEQPFDPLGLHKRLQESTRMSLIASAPRFPGPNSIYEMAALTQELNTYQLTTKVREVLAAHNIGQKLFGETILGLSQGSVSELLTKPKPWHMLSIKGREPFIRMHLWLNDPMNIDKLHSIKEEKDCLKRKRENSIDPISNPSSPKTDPDDGHDSPVGKRYRSHFSDRQREALKVAFALDSYPSQTTIEFLGRELDLEPKDIVNWFHNHRMRLKQVQPHDMESILTSNKVEESFDPLKFRILVNQRWLELCEEQEVPDSPIADANRAASGLDLSHQDLEKDDVGAEDLRRSKDGSRKSEVGSDQEEIEQPVSKSNGRSRRKPLLPQWLHPSAGLEESKLSGHVDINSSESKELVATK